MGERGGAEVAGGELGLVSGLGVVSGAELDELKVDAGGVSALG